MVKTCPVCTRTLPLSAYIITPEGKPRSRCRQCMAAACAMRRRAKKFGPLIRKPDPLNSLLRDMPGNRGLLLGAVEFNPRIAA